MRSIAICTAQLKISIHHVHARPFAVLAGLRRLTDDEDLRFLQPYIAKVQAIDANVFDLSVTMVHPATNAEAFRPHYDITLSDHINHRASIGGLTVRSSLQCKSFSLRDRCC